jgi:hypothetical protein
MPISSAGMKGFFAAAVVPVAKSEITKPCSKHLRTHFTTGWVAGFRGWSAPALPEAHSMILDLIMVSTRTSPIEGQAGANNAA